jgi:hypothetical protein
VVVIERVVKVYVAPAGSWPEFRPRPPFEIKITALDLDGLFDAIRERLTSDGYKVRCLGMCRYGLLAFVEERS